MPNEFKKVDLDVKLFSNCYYPVELKAYLNTCLHYSVQISTGMITADFREYLQIGVFNTSNETVTLPAGTFMCKIFVHNYPVRLRDEYECDFVDHGGDLDPYNLYIDRLEKYVDYDKEAFEL
jgi:hypothetical protein